MKNQPCPNCGGTEQDYNEYDNRVFFLKCKCGFSFHTDEGNTEEQAWEKWNAFNLRMGQVVTQNCIMFGAEILWKQKHPASKGRFPDSYYETSAKKYKKWIEKHQK